MSSGSKECLRSMLRAHSRGQNSVFYRKRKENNVVCFGIRSDASKSSNHGEQMTEDESEDETRTRSRDDEDASRESQYLESTESENVAPDSSVHLPMKRKGNGDEPPSKRSLRPKPQRTSDTDRTTQVEHASSSSSVGRPGACSPNTVLSPDESAAFATTVTTIVTTGPKVIVKRGFLTLREMLISHIEPYGLKLGRRPQKKTSMSQQLEDSKKSAIDIETPDSILVGLNIKEILNIHSFKLLPKNYQHKLLSLLPPVDRKNDGNIETALNNEFFASACQEWRERLSDGELTPENQTKLKSDYEKLLRCVDPWKMKHFEDSWGRSPYENSLMERQRFQKMRELHEKMLESKRKKQEEDRIQATTAAAAGAVIATPMTTSSTTATTATTAAVAATTMTTSTTSIMSQVSEVPEVETLLKVSVHLQSTPSKDTKETMLLISQQASLSAASTTVQAVSSKTKRDAEDTLLEKEQQKIALLLPYYSPLLHRIVAEHGIPVSSNHRKKCNNLVPLSMCFSAKRIGTSSLAPAKCFLGSPLVIPRRHIRFYHHQSHRSARCEQRKRENQLRFQRELQALEEGLKRLEQYSVNPVQKMLPVPTEVQELVDEVLGLVETDRIHDYSSYATSSYATSTVGTPSHGGTTIDENFGSELMFSVATDEEPPTDMSDESRPQTAFDNDVVMNECDEVEDVIDGDDDDDEDKDNNTTRNISNENNHNGEHEHDDVNQGDRSGDDDGDDQDDDEIEVKIEAALSEDDTREATTPELPQLSQKQEKVEQIGVNDCAAKKNEQNASVNNLYNRSSSTSHLEKELQAQQHHQKQNSSDQAQCEGTFVGDIVDEQQSSSRDADNSKERKNESNEEHGNETKKLCELDKELQGASTSEIIEKLNEANNDESSSVICEILDEDCGSDHSDNEPKSTTGEAQTIEDKVNHQDITRIPSSWNGEKTEVNYGKKNPCFDEPSCESVDNTGRSVMLETSLSDPEKEQSPTLNFNHKRKGATATTAAMATKSTTSSITGKTSKDTGSGNLFPLPKGTGELSGENHQLVASTTFTPSTTTTTTSILETITASNSQWHDCMNQIKSSPPSSSDSTLSDEDTDIDSSGGLHANFGNNDDEETGSDSTIEEVLPFYHQSKQQEQQRQQQPQEPQQQVPQLNQSTSEICSSFNCSKAEKDDTSGRPASFVTGGLVAPPLPIRCRAQASGYSSRRRRRALSCRDLLIAAEQRKKGQQRNRSPCCLQDGNRGEHSNGCFCKLQPMLPCQRCGAFWHSDCIGPSRICSTCLLV